jgi:DNA-binding NarL/FixJ family response regulator
LQFEKGLGRRVSGEILVVDDDACCRALIVDTLRGAGFATVEAGSGEEALTRMSEPRALVVLDVNLPGISGYETCRRLRDDHGANLPIVFVSGERTESYDRVAGLLIGADDYIVKPFAPDELVVRVRRLIQRAPRAARGPLTSRLTRRELDVLSLLAEGSGQDEIAVALFISPKTVATHIEHILTKLGVNSRAQAVAVAYRERLLDDSEPSAVDATQV